MKVTCPKCEAVYQIADSRIPNEGIYGRCPKCNERFFLKNKNIKASGVQTKIRQDYKDHITRKRAAKAKAIETPEEEPVGSEILNCPICGKNISINIKSCPHCGTPLKFETINPLEKFEKINQLGNNIIKGGCALGTLGAVLPLLILFVLFILGMLPNC